jgi:hypothetical protein
MSVGLPVVAIVLLHQVIFVLLFMLNGGAVAFLLLLARNVAYWARHEFKLWKLYIRNGIQVFE